MVARPSAARPLLFALLPVGLAALILFVASPADTQGPPTATPNPAPTRSVSLETMPVPRSSDLLYPPGEEPRPAATPSAGVRAAGEVEDPLFDTVSPSLAWPLDSPRKGVSVSGSTVQANVLAYFLPGNYWYAATMQASGDTLVMRDHAPNDRPVTIGPTGHADDSTGDGAPAWADIVSADQTLQDPNRHFAMTVAASIPSSAVDMMYAWPILDYKGDVLHLSMVYLGPYGWEVAVQSSTFPQGIGCFSSEIKHARVYRDPAGFVRFEIKAPLSVFAYGYHVPILPPLYRFYLDADNNPSTGASNGAEVAVQILYDPGPRWTEARVLRWNGQDWVESLLLPPPIISGPTGPDTATAVAGPVSLGLGQQFSWWVDSYMWMVPRRGGWITSAVDRAPDAGVVSEGPEFWVIPSPTPTRTATPTRTPIAPITFSGRAYTSRHNLAGAVVILEYLQQVDLSFRTVATTATAADGTYSMRVNLGRTTDWRVRCVANTDWGTVERYQFMPEVSPPEVWQDFYFESVIRLQGRIVDTSGTPVPSAGLRVAYCSSRPDCLTLKSDWSNSAYVDSEGRFEANALNDSPPDSVRLKVIPPAGMVTSDIIAPGYCSMFGPDIIQCNNVPEGIHGGITFVLSRAPSPSPTPTATPTRPAEWLDWDDSAARPVGTTGRDLSLRFQVAQTGTLTVTLGPGLEFGAGGTVRTWKLMVKQGRLVVPVHALPGSLGGESWARAELFGLSDTVAMPLDWQLLIPEAARTTGWAKYAFGIEIVDVDTGQPLQGNYFFFKKKVGPDAVDYTFATGMTIQGKVIAELEGVLPPYEFSIVFDSVMLDGARHVIDRVQISGPGVLEIPVEGGPAAIVYHNLPPGSYVYNKVWMKKAR